MLNLFHQRLTYIWCTQVFDSLYVVLDDLVFNTQFAYLWMQAVLLFSPNLSWIRIWQTSYRGFSSKTKRKLARSFFHVPVYRWCPFTKWFYVWWICWSQSLLVKWCGHASANHMWVKCEHRYNYENKTKTKKAIIWNSILKLFNLCEFLK